MRNPISALILTAVNLHYGKLEPLALVRAVGLGVTNLFFGFGRDFGARGRGANMAEIVWCHSPLLKTC